MHANTSFTFSKSVKIGTKNIVIKKFIDCETPTNPAHKNGIPKRKNVQNHPNLLLVIEPHIVVKKPKNNGI